MSIQSNKSESFQRDQSISPAGYTPFPKAAQLSIDTSKMQELAYHLLDSSQHLSMSIQGATEWNGQFSNELELTSKTCFGGVQIATFKRKRHEIENNREVVEVSTLKVETEKKKSKTQSNTIEGFEIQMLPLELQCNIFQHYAESLQNILALRMVSKEMEMIANALMIRELHSRSLTANEEGRQEQILETEQKNFDEHMQKVDEWLLPCTHVSFQDLKIYSNRRRDFFKEFTYKHIGGTFHHLIEEDNRSHFTILRSFYSFCKQPILHFDLESLTILEMYSNFLLQQNVAFKPIGLIFDVDYKEEGENYQKILTPFFTDELSLLFFYSDRNSLNPLPLDYIEKILCGSHLPRLRHLTMTLTDAAPLLGFNENTRLKSAHAGQLTTLAPHLTYLEFNEFSCSDEFMIELSKGELQEIDTLHFTNCFLESAIGAISIISSGSLTNLRQLIIPLHFEKNEEENSDLVLRIKKCIPRMQVTEQTTSLRQMKHAVFSFMIGD